MATLKPFRSTTLEGAFLEAAFMLEKIESAINISKRLSKEDYEANKGTTSTNAPNVGDKFTQTQYFIITIDTAQQRCILNATLPSRIKDNSFGGYILAKEIFPDAAFQNISDNILEEI